MPVRRVLFGLLVAVWVMAQFAWPGMQFAKAEPVYPELISQNSNGESSNGWTTADVGGLMSDDGRYVAFLSTATNLDSRFTENPYGATYHIYVRDRVMETTKLVSVNAAGEPQNNNYWADLWAFSGSGRYVFFGAPGATNMGDDNGLFRYDLFTDTTELVAPEGYYLTTSYDGDKIAYMVATNDTQTLFLKDISNGVITAVGPGTTPQLTGDGSKILYLDESTASAQEPPYSMVKLYDVSTGTATRVDEGDQGPQGAQPRAISRDGHYAFFNSYDPDLTANTPVDCQYNGCLYRKDLTSDSLALVHLSNGAETVPYLEKNAVSGDGNKIIVSNSNAETGVLLYDFETGDTYPVGYGMDWATPSNGPWSYGFSLRYDGSEITLSSGASNFGVEKNCHGTGELDPNELFYCGDVFVSTTAKKPSAGDTVAPIVGTASWSANPKSSSQNSVLTVPATDNVGVVSGEYYLGDTDPGQGNATQMTWDGGSLTATFGTDVPTGVHKVAVRAADAAGNWSELAVDYLVVYNPSGARMTGQRTVTPSLTNGDVLPGLISSNQNDRATFGFNVRYNTQGQISSGSDLQFRYRTGSLCLFPNWAQNCHTLELNATSIAWLTTQGVNDSEGIFQGTANMRVDGVESMVLFRVTGLDGGRLNPATDDHFMLKIYAEGTNPNIDQPLYQVSSEVNRGNIRIIF